MSPAAAGESSASKRRKTAFDASGARLPCAAPVAGVPAGSTQLNGSAAPGAEVTPVAEHSEGALQVALAGPAVSQTKRTRLPAGGVITSLMRTPVADAGVLLVTVTR